MENISPIPPEILDNHKDVVLSMDVIKVNTVPFQLHTPEHCNLEMHLNFNIEK